MKWLLDEMLPSATCRRLLSLGHDALSVHDANIRGAEDALVFELAVRQQRVLVMENFADYAILLEQRLGRGEPCVPVVFVRKSSLPGRGALPARLAQRLDRWAKANPHPYLGPHWA